MLGHVFMNFRNIENKFLFFEKYDKRSLQVNVDHLIKEIDSYILI